MEEEEAGDEFSEDEFDPVEFDYENIRRPSPEGAEDRAGQHDDAYDLAELNASFGEDAAADGEKNAISHNSRTRYVQNPPRQ